MKTDISEYFDRRNDRIRKRHRALAFLTALSVLVSGSVFWQLRGVGTALENTALTNDAEVHTHSEKCYEKQLVCGLEESEGHKHTAECYEQTYICGLEEHTHSEECCETRLICGLEEGEEHQHTDECYEKVLICGKEEHTHTDGCVENRLVCGCEESPGHTHTDKCYEKKLICGKEENTGQITQRETEEIWKAALPKEYTDDVRENIALTAESQLGYTEEAGSYSRYGEWYGSPNTEWNTMFTYFCMYYGGADRQTVPYDSGAEAWASELRKAGLLLEIKNNQPARGDVILTDTDLDGRADRSAVVTESKEKALKAIEGDADGIVAESEIALSDKHILGYVDLEYADGSQGFEESTASGIKVTARAEKGAFPDKTTMTVTDIDKSEAEQTAQAAAAEDRTVAEAVAVDITFRDENGREIEPADSRKVKVQIVLPESQQFDEGEYSLLHVSDDGNVERICSANVTAEGAEFKTESFSIFILTRDKGYVEPGQLVMIGGDYGSVRENSEENPYMIYIGETITIRYSGEYTDAGSFTVYGNNYGDDLHYIVRTPDGGDTIVTEEENRYKQAQFSGSTAGKCRIVYLDDSNQWGSEEHVNADLWVQVVDPIYIKTYYGDKGKDWIKEYLGGYDWIKDKNGYIQNTNGKPYLLRVGDTVSIKCNAEGDFVESVNDTVASVWGDYLEEIEPEFEGYTTYRAKAPTRRETDDPEHPYVDFTVLIRHMNGDTVNDRLYVRVLPAENEIFTHCDMEIADDGKYTLTEFTDTGKVEKIYRAYVTKIESDTILRDADGNEVNRMPVDAYRKIGIPGQTQYEMTSAYYTGNYAYLGDNSLLHSPKEYPLYDPVDHTELTELPGNDVHPLFYTDVHYSYNFDVNRVKSVDFNVEITLYPDTIIEYNTQGEVVSTAALTGEPQKLNNTKVHFEGQTLEDAFNKCPLDNGLDFTYMPAGALVKLQANKEITNAGLNAREGQFEFELYSIEYQGAKVGSVNGTGQLPENQFNVTDVLPYATEDDTVKAFQLVQHSDPMGFVTANFDQTGFMNEYGNIDWIGMCQLIDGCKIGVKPTALQQQFYTVMGKYLTEAAGVSPTKSETYPEGQFDLANGHYIFRNEHIEVTASNDANGKVVFPYLEFTEEDKGKTFIYYMREVVDPNDPEVSNYDTTVHTVSITVGDDMSVSVRYDDDVTPPTFSNTLREYLLPNTGGPGIVPYAAAGTGLIIASAALFLYKKRREAG